MDSMNSNKNSGKTVSFSPKTDEITNIIIDKFSSINVIGSFIFDVQRLTGLRYSDCTAITLGKIRNRSGQIQSEFIVHQIKIYNGTLTRINNHVKKKRWLKAKKVEAARNNSKVRIFVSQALKGVFESIIAWQVENNPHFNASSDDTFLFANAHHHSKGRPPNKNSMNEHLKSVRFTEMLEPYNISTANLGTHSFRKRFGQTLLKELNADIHLIMELLGQASLESTVKYLSTSAEDKRFYLEQLSSKTNRKPTAEAAVRQEESEVPKRKVEIVEPVATNDSSMDAVKLKAINTTLQESGMDAEANMAIVTIFLSEQPVMVKIKKIKEALGMLGASDAVILSVVSEML